MRISYVRDEIWVSRSHYASPEPLVAPAGNESYRLRNTGLTGEVRKVIVKLLSRIGPRTEGPKARPGSGHPPYSATLRQESTP